MRTSISFIAALLVAAALGAGLFVFRSQRAARAEVAAAQRQAQEAAQTLAAEQAQRQALEQQRDQLIQIADEVGAELRKANEKSPPPPATPPVPAPEKPKPALGKLMSQMMNDPETRKFVRQQQQVMMDQLYRPLITRLGLSADESTEFKRLLLDRMVASSEKALGLMGMEGEDRTRALQALADDQKQSEEEIRTFLGESRYLEYKDYQETVGERTQLNMFRQGDAVGRTLSDDQTDQLLRVMAQEKKALQETAGAVFPGATQDPAAMQQMLNDDQAAKVIETQERLNRRVYERAVDFLSEEQLKSFAGFQANQLDMMRVGLKMARQMFEP